MNPNKDIYLYSDYRSFLRDYFRSRKKAMPAFTYQLFAELAGFASASFSKLVMTGVKNLGEESIAKIAAAIKLNRNATAYFQNLVLFNQTRDLEKKLCYLKKLDSYRRKNSPEKVLPSQYKYFRKWYYCVIREMVEFAGFQEDPEWIAPRIPGKLSPHDVAQALKVLLETGFLVRDSSGILVKTDTTLATGDVCEQDALGLLIRGFHLQMLDRARDTIADLPKEQRSVTNTTLSMSRKTYALALKRIEQMRMELLELARSDPDPDTVFQLMVTVFPLAENRV